MRSTSRQRRMKIIIVEQELGWMAERPSWDICRQTKRPSWNWPMFFVRCSPAIFTAALLAHSTTPLLRQSMENTPLSSHPLVHRPLPATSDLCSHSFTTRVHTALSFRATRERTIILIVTALAPAAAELVEQQAEEKARKAAAQCMQTRATHRTAATAAPTTRTEASWRIAAGR